MASQSSAQEESVLTTRGVEGWGGLLSEEVGLSGHGGVLASTPYGENLGECWLIITGHSYARHLPSHFRLPSYQPSVHNLHYRQGLASEKGKAQDHRTNRGQSQAGSVGPLPEPPSFLLHCLPVQRDVLLG